MSLTVRAFKLLKFAVATIRKNLFYEVEDIFPINAEYKKPTNGMVCGGGA